MKKKIVIALLAITMIFNIKVYARNVLIAEVPKNNNPTLKELRISSSELSPKFDSSVIEYCAIVAENTSKVDITAVPADINAKVEISGNTNLKKGANTVLIKVTAENGNEKRTYKINITRGDAQKANINITKFEIEGHSMVPAFNPNNADYVVELKKEDTSLNFNIVPESNKARVEIVGNENLDKALNIITIKIIAEDNITTRTYNIVATKSGGLPATYENQEENFLDETLIEENQDDSIGVQDGRHPARNIKTIIIITTILCTSAIVIAIICIMKYRKNKKGDTNAKIK